MRGHLKKIGNNWFVNYKIMSDTYNTPIHKEQISDSLEDGAFVLFDIEEQYLKNYTTEEIAVITYGIDTVTLNIPKEDLEEVTGLFLKAIAENSTSNAVHTLLMNFCDKYNPITDDEYIKMCRIR